MFKPKYHKLVKSKVYGDYTEYTLKHDPTVFIGAKCDGLDTDIFYPVQEKFDLASEQYITKRLCGGCPVKDACLEWGLAHERFGIWGGTTAYRRKLMRKRHKMLMNDIALPSNKR